MPGAIKHRVPMGFERGSFGDRAVASTINKLKMNEIIVFKHLLVSFRVCRERVSMVLVRSEKKESIHITPMLDLENIESGWGLLPFHIPTCIDDPLGAPGTKSDDHEIVVVLQDLT